MTRENHYDILTLLAYGGVAEWFKAPVLKTGDSARDRGFESHLLRHSFYWTTATVRHCSKPTENKV